MKRWTPEEDTALLEAFGRTFSYDATAEILGRTRKSVSSRLERLRSKGVETPRFGYLPGQSTVPCGYRRCDNIFTRPTGPGRGHEKYCSPECERGEVRLRNRLDPDAPDRDYTLCPKCEINPRSTRPDGRLRGWCKPCESAQKAEYALTDAGKATWRRWYHKKRAKVNG